MTTFSHSLVLAILVGALVPPHASSFSIISSSSIHRIHHPLVQPTKLYSTTEADDGIQDQLAKAKKLIAEAKAKIAAAEAAKEAEGIDTPSVDTKAESNKLDKENEKRKIVTKTKNEETGLITTDGELMAALSEDEDWEIKELMDVFDSESTRGRHDPLESQLASRDVAASIYNMRKHLQDSDYRRIFNKNHPFIGEGN